MGDEDQRLRESIGRSEARKIASRSRGSSMAAWLGTFGMVGWSVAVPALVGVAAGRWLDARTEGQVSWTVTLLLLGLGIGCANAWYWVSRESRRELPHHDEGEED